MTSQAHGLSARAADHPAVEIGARAGHVANGIVNILVGWIALQLAWGGGAGEASTSGALDTLAATPVGTVLLVVVIAGFALLGLWYLTGVLLQSEVKDRLVSAARGVTYLVLGGLAVTVLAGSGGGEGESQQASSVTATAMSQPLGRVLVGVVGLGIAALGIRHVVKGLKKKFLEDLARRPAPWAVHAGRIGYTARGATFLIIGGFVVTAAVTADPDEARGLDGALQSLLELPFGSWLLTVVALGFVAYGVYCFARARYTEN